MTHSGGHRVRSVARWVATPALLAAAGLAGYANMVGATLLLRVSTVVALAVAVGAVVLFDTQLVRARRAHNAERAALARSYAATYAAHIRVTDPGSPSEWAPVSDRPPEPWPAASSAPTVSVTTGGTPAPRSSRSNAVTRTAASTATPTAPAHDAPAPAVASHATPAHSVASHAAPVPTASEPANVTAEETHQSTDTTDMWDALEDAPTVVDMLAWEERARVGIVDSDQPAASSSGSGSSARAADNRSDEPTDDPRLHLHGPTTGRAESA